MPLEPNKLGRQSGTEVSALSVFLITSPKDQKIRGPRPLQIFRLKLQTLEKSACAGDTAEIWRSLSFTSCVSRLCFCSLVRAASRPLLLDLCCRCTLRALRCETCCRQHLSIICEMVFFVVRFRFRNFLPSISLIALFCSCLSSVHCLPAGP